MSRLLQHINEDIVETEGMMAEMDEMERAISLIKHGWWNHISIWRGFHGAGNKTVVKVLNNREGWGKFRGALGGEVPKTLKMMGLIDPPVFCTADRHEASFFGHPRLIIPIGEFKTYWNESEEAFDILHAVHKDFEEKLPSGTVVHGSQAKNDKELKKLASEYKGFNNTFPPNMGKYHEVIVECKEYYLLFTDLMIHRYKWGKFTRIKKEDDVKSYKDAVDVYNDYKAYWRWSMRRKFKENVYDYASPGADIKKRRDAILKNYLEMGYPSEWFKDL
jgi:hypothetical protein